MKDVEKLSLFNGLVSQNQVKQITRLQTIKISYILDAMMFGEKKILVLQIYVYSRSSKTIRI